MKQVALDIPREHPSFAGHFPDRPIVPGVVLLDAAQSSIEANNNLSLIGIAVAKFYQPVNPGEALILSYEINGSAVRFEMKSGERKIADGRFIARMESLSA